MSGPLEADVRRFAEATGVYGAGFYGPTFDMKDVRVVKLTHDRVE